MKRLGLVAAVIVGTVAVGGLVWGAVGERSTEPRLTITGAYVREPASPDVVAAYLTIRNRGGSADEIQAVRTDAGGSAMPMREEPGGAMSAATLTIGARSTLTLRPGQAHIMIENPTRALRPGDRVRITLTFATSDPITVEAPVIAITAPAPTG
jgi:copper(I)-binding protein